MKTFRTFCVFQPFNKRTAFRNNRIVVPDADSVRNVQDRDQLGLMHLKGLHWGGRGGGGAIKPNLGLPYKKPVLHGGVRIA